MEINRNKIKYLFITFIILLVALELLIRAYFGITGNDIKAFNKYPGRYIGSHFTGFKLKPNWEINHNTFKEKINSFGFKSPDISINKKNGSYRIICIGGSLVYGRDTGTTWPYFLNQHFNNNSLIKEVEVINAGVPGYTSYHTLTQFITKLVDLQPDLIISYQLFTDLWYYNDINKDIIIGDNFDQFSTEFSIHRLFDKYYSFVLLNVIKRKLFFQVDNEKMPESIESPIFDSDVLKYYERNMNILASTCNLYEIDLILSIPISLYKEFNSEEEIKKIADYSNKSFYLDFIRQGKKILEKISKNYDGVYYLDPSININPTLGILNDRYHLNTDGNKRIAEEIFLFIKKF